MSNERVDWRMGKDAEGHYREWEGLKSPSIPVPGPKYVCDQCKRVHYHSLTYCTGCPGKLRQVTARNYGEMAEKMKGFVLGPY